MVDVSLNFLFNKGYEPWTIILHELRRFSRLEYLACRRDAILLYT